MSDTTSLVSRVVEVFKGLIGGTIEVGTNDLLKRLAQELNITFERARDLLYEAVDAHLLVITSRFTIQAA